MSRWTAVAVVLLALVSGAIWADEAQVGFAVAGDGYIPVTTVRTEAPTTVLQPGAGEQAGSYLTTGQAPSADQRWIVMGDGYVPARTTVTEAPVTHVCDAACMAGCHGDRAEVRTTSAGPQSCCALQ